MMKKLLLVATIICFSASNLQAQYIETFDTDGIGVVGPCTGSDISTCASNNLGSVQWKLQGDFSGVDSEPVTVTGGELKFEDVDEEVCWRSPLLDISGSGPVDFEIPFLAIGYDTDDYINVSYIVDGGSEVVLPNQFGGGAGTVQYFGSRLTISETVTASGITGNTLMIRVCVDHNSTVEEVRIDDIFVPTAGVGTLPIELLYFNATKSGNEVLLEWVTASEENNDFFEVEVSNDGIDYKAVGLVQGAGTTNIQQSYSVIHPNPSLGYNYYRLKQVDFDGAYTYSEVRLVDFEGREGIHIFPNPARDFVSIVNSTDERIEKLNLYNIQGQLLRTLNSSGKELIQGLDVSSLASGVYMIQYDLGNKSMTEKLVVQ